MQWCYCIFSFLGKRGPGTTGNSYTSNFSLRLFFQRHHLCRFLGSESREKQRALVTGELWPKRHPRENRRREILISLQAYLEGRIKGTYLIIYPQARHYCPPSASHGPQISCPDHRCAKGVPGHPMWHPVFPAAPLPHFLSDYPSQLSRELFD